ncbi:hypothetical protein CTAYLR_003263 [Chrysophaeum taylorii]|uniref:Choline transporter-like protein n=1 Tax=Chrysophaeum taylorii TaxID=2483200 RepID=A0AAD7UC33_9STRA|nr:hypothetical protein CTAYLR_003263 [Chrysophaeum taylorii]
MADVEEEEGEKVLTEIERASSMSAVQHPPETNRSILKLPDLAFGIAWIIAVAAMVGIAIDYGWDEIGTSNYDSAHKKKMAVKHLIRIFIVAFLFALAVAQVLMHVMMRFGGLMIHASLFMIEGLLLATAILCGQYSRWYLGFFFAVCCFMTLCFHFFARHRIAFAAATLHVGCEIVLSYHVLQVIGFVFAITAVGFFFIFALAIYGFYNYKTHKDASSKEIAIAIVCFILIFFWTQQVFKYIIIATTAGTSQSWWYGRLPSLVVHPAVDALARSCTYNLGSICFGALFVAIVETLVVVVAYVRKKAKDYPGGCCVSCLLGCVQCCLGCCEAILDYINKYAFVYVGIHGYSFLYAGKQVVELFSTHGLTAIGNDYFTDVVLFMNSVMIGLVTAMFGVFLVQFGPDDWHEGASDVEIVVGIFCGIGGLAVSSVVFALVDGANKSVLVLFAENPHILEHTHSADYGRLSKVWTLIGNEIPEEEDEEKK